MIPYREQFLSWSCQTLLPSFKNPKTCRVFNLFQTSYFIVDEAVCELGLPPDPFLANSKAVPAQLPYKENKKSK